MSHFSAVRDLLAPLGYDVYLDGDTPASPPWPYAVLFMDTGAGSRTKLCQSTDETARWIQVTSVGLTRESVEAVSEAVVGLLTDARPVVTGWKCNTIEHAYSSTVMPDDDLKDPHTGLRPKTAVDRFRYTARKA